VTESSPKPGSRVLPFAIAAILLLVATGFVVSLLSKPASGDEELGERGKGKRTSKSTPRYTGSSSSDSRHEGKSEGKSEEERIAGKPAPPRESPKQMVVRVSAEAQDELKRLRERSKTVFEDPEERRAFAERLAKITDAEERKKVLRTRTEKMQAARRAAEERKQSVDIERENRLVILIQTQNHWRMAEQVAKSNAKLRGEAFAFNRRLAKWLENSGGLDNETFHAQFSALRAELGTLRKKGGIVRRPSPPPPSQP